MNRLAQCLAWVPIVTSLGCSKTEATTIEIPFLNASKLPVYAPYVPRIEAGVLAAISAANATGKFYNGFTLAAAEQFGTGNAIGGDANDTRAEQAMVDQMMASSTVKLLIGPATWTDGQDFCTTHQYLCISHAAATVRNDPNQAFSFTTAGFFPGWAVATAYDISRQGFTKVQFVADYDTTYDIQQMSRYGLNITSLPVPAEDPQNWTTSPDAVAQQIIGADPNSAIILESATGFAAIFSALRQHGFANNSRIWVGGEVDFQDFITQVGNTAAVGVNKVYDESKDPEAAAYQVYQQQYKTWSANLPPGEGNWELDAYMASMLSIYTLHAQYVSQNGVASSVLSGDNLRQTLLRLTTPDAGATEYWLSDTANILSAISARQHVTIAGLGLPIRFSEYGTPYANELKYSCCKTDSGGASTGVYTTTVITPDEVLAAAGQ